VKKLGGLIILISDEMFERVMAQAREVAEEQFRRMVSDTGMRAEAAQFLHDRVVDSIAELYVDDLADLAGEYIARERKPR